MNVVNILQGHENIELIVVGGAFRHADGGIVGEAAVDFIQQFRVDYAVVGASAIDEDGVLLDFDYREVKVAKTIMQKARRSLLVADGMKYARAAPVRIGHLSEFDCYVTDAKPPPAIVALCSEHGVAIEIADPDDRVQGALET